MSFVFRMITGLLAELSHRHFSSSKSLLYYFDFLSLSEPGFATAPPAEAAAADFARFHHFILFVTLPLATSSRLRYISSTPIRHTPPDFRLTAEAAAAMRRCWRQMRRIYADAAARGSRAAILID